MEINKLDNELIDLTLKYGRKLGLRNLSICRNDRMWYWGCAGKSGRKYQITYNFKAMRNTSKSNRVWVMLHELGHLVGNNFHARNGRIMSEYLAEKKAFVWAKKYFPKEYKKMVRGIPSFLNHMLEYYPIKYGYYYEAFSQIPEYEKCIKIRV